jgi:hypothetical protein
LVLVKCALVLVRLSPGVGSAVAELGVGERWFVGFAEKSNDSLANLVFGYGTVAARLVCGAVM